MPLHFACDTGKTGAAQVLYDSYPEAILTRNRNGKTPIDLAREWAERVGTNTTLVPFLEVQLAYARRAQDITIMNTPDKHGWLPTIMNTPDKPGWLPLHHALMDNAPLGSIKLLVKGNPSAVQTTDNHMAFPLHLACEFSSVKVVQFLVEKYDSAVDCIDKSKDSILHYACHGGNLGVVKYLLESHAHLVASATVNDKGELPIHLLCDTGKGKEVDNESTAYIEIIWLLLLVDPEVVLA